MEVTGKEENGCLNGLLMFLFDRRRKEEMKGKYLIDAVWKDNEEEVLRLIDEEEVDVDGRNQVSFFLLFLS